jgi:5'-3' exonuclease
VDEIGYLELKGPKKLTGTGISFFYSQLLTGDATDTYDGLPGCGPIRAYDLLKDCKTERELYEATLGAYQKKFPEDAGERLTEQAHLAYMIRELNEDGTIKHWEEPCLMLENK